MQLTARIERFPIAGRFTISRGSKTEAVVVVAEISAEGHTGWGECVPYGRYGETPELVLAQISGVADAVTSGATRENLLDLMPAGAARNAVDCALWDLWAKRAGRPAFALAGLPPPEPVLTCYTISLDTPESMAEAARAAGKPLLKLKLGGIGDPERIRAVRAAVPHARLVVDANEAWRPDNLAEHLAAAHAAGIELVEQPLPADADDALRGFEPPVRICADESAHGLDVLDDIAARYDAINIKLDKTGGLTAALELIRAARGRQLRVMIGSMVGTSLGVAPALLLAQAAEWVDLDGPLLLAHDRPEGVGHTGGIISAPALWGQP